MTAEEAAANAPEGTQTLPMTGVADMKFTMTVSALDCTGCGSCVNVCPGKKGAKKHWLWKTWKQMQAEQKFFDYGVKFR